MIYTPETSAKILDAMSGIAMSNNGWSWVENDATLIEALRVAGYTMIETTAGVKAYSRAAQAALAAEYTAHGSASFAVPARAVRSAPKEHGPDYEAMILTRQERWMMDA
jgi:hypothetical protein